MEKMMTTQKTDRAQLLENASYLFRVRGYHNTSISDIAKACNLSKGSVYHYITSKKELAVTVINQAHTEFKKHVFDLAYNEQLPAHQRLENMSDAVVAFFSEREGGSLMSNLAHEAIDTVPDFVHLIKAFYADWINAFKHVFGQVLPADKAHELAEDAVCQYQGAILLTRLHNDSKPLVRVGQQLAGHIAANN